jgi:hypothetical protein
MCFQIPVVFVLSQAREYADPYVRYAANGGSVHHVIADQDSYFCSCVKGCIVSHFTERSSQTLSLVLRESNMLR